MVKNNSESADTSPYGDLQGVKAQHAKGQGNKESTVRLISNDKSDDHSESDSELALAVDDILSCCDPNSAQAKLIRDMGRSMIERTNHLGDDEEKQEFFSDEYPKQPSLLGKFSPSKIIESMKGGGSSSMPRSNTYPVRSSSSFAGPVKKQNSRSTCRYGVLCAVLILAVAALCAVIAVIVSTDSRHSAPAVHSEHSHPIKDCSLVGDQDHPNVLSQCACSGSISIISEKAKEKYHTFLDAFGAEYLQQRESMDSCSARNQALVWLAEDKGSILSDVLIQRHSLVLFFIKLNGLEWTLEDGHQKWMTSDHECTWFGVACNEDKEVTAIDLWDVNLDGPLPKELMSLTSLERLALPENKITGHLPVDAFVMMSKLTDLSLFMNSISGPIDGRIFDSVKKLETLNIDSNDLTGSIPAEIGQLTGLQELKLARNYLKSTLPTELGSLTLLKKMELEENNISGILPSEIGNLHQLEYLDLSWNTLQASSIPWEFQGLRNLKELFLKSNDLGGNLPTILGVMSNLESLVLSLNAFTGEIPSVVNHLSSLSILHLDGNKLTGTIPPEIGSCSLLRELRLDYNSLTGAMPTEIGRLGWLVSFNMEGNVLTGTMPEEVCNLRGENTLQTLSATCTAELDSTAVRNQEVFGKASEFTCRVPDCCTTCELR